MLSLNIRVYNGREAIVELAKMIVEERRKKKMEKILKYSVLRYSPSSVSGEKINLGIIFFDETLN